MNMNSQMLIARPSSFLTTACTPPKSFVSTIPLTMFAGIKTLLTQLLTVMSWFTPLKQVLTRTLTGMPVLLGYFMLVSCMSVSNLQITPRKIWSSYGFAGLARYLATISAWRQPDFPKLDLCLGKTIRRSAFLIRLLLFRVVILYLHSVKGRQMNFCLRRLQLLGFQEMS